MRTTRSIFQAPASAAGDCDALSWVDPSTLLGGLRKVGVGEKATNGRAPPDTCERSMCLWILRRELWIRRDTDGLCDAFAQPCACTP